MHGRADTFPTRPVRKRWCSAEETDCGPRSRATASVLRVRGRAQASGLLADSGLADDGRLASHMASEVEAMRKRVRKAHMDAIAAERRDEPLGEDR